MWFIRHFVALICSVLLCGPFVLAAEGKTDKAPIPFPLPNPSDVGEERFVELLSAFLESGQYENWAHDKKVRSTGPYISEPPEPPRSFGTHGAGGVKIYYSPQMMMWMNNERKGDIPDGSMIIKTTYPRDPDDPEKFATALGGFTIMVRDRRGSWDGWFWTDGGPLSKPKPENAEKFFDPNARFGMSCVNCHASADNKFLTYSTLRNIYGDPITYTDVITTVPHHNEGDVKSGVHDGPSKNTRKPELRPFHPVRKVLKDVWNVYDKLPDAFQPEPLPFCSLDHVVQGPQPNGQLPFITSNQCMSCHDATQSYSIVPNMALAKKSQAGEKTYVNASPYGEWRYSMMALSGRDPIFYAQLETERALHPELAKEIDNKCLSCHAVMGQRQWIEDKGPDALFTHDMVNLTPENNPALSKYGALARDGVSCTVCHQIQPEGLGTPSTYTGEFKLPKTHHEIFGPYKDKDITTYPMEMALGLTPKYAAHLSQSKLCSSCHTVFTPVLDVGKKYTAKEFGDKAHSVGGAGDAFHEQATYLEWKNSTYSDEAGQNSRKKSCQDCHMPKTYFDKSYGSVPLQFRTANIEDKAFPYVENRAPDAKITLKVRGKDAENPYSRHSLNGINVFGTAMFDQFPWLLGIQRRDALFPADEAESGMKVALDAGIAFAQRETAQIEVSNLTKTENGLEVEVTIDNLTGHRFPTGVAFRRAFVELRVKAGEKTIWVSGATDENGVIGVIGKTANPKFTPLPTEFFEKNQYQPHHRVITREDQVQIYEQLVADSNGEITTSFLSYKKELKNNRLMPHGWSEKGPDAAETAPIGEAATDDHYKDGKGTDVLKYDIALKLPPEEQISVTATLYYQSIPPYYLKQRFKYIDQPATRNLYYFIHELNLQRKEMKDWKLEIDQDSKTL